MQEAFDPEKGLFLSTEGGELYPNPSAHRHFANPTASLRFLGAMLGKAMYEGIMIEVPLATRSASAQLLRGLMPCMHRRCKLQANRTYT